MVLSQRRLPEVRCQSDWFIVFGNCPYYSDETPVTIELEQAFDRIIGYYKKTGSYFEVRYEGNEYSPKKRVEGVFTLTFKQFNFDKNTSGYGDCLFTEKHTTDCLNEFIHLLNDFIKKSECQ
ncbi:hypothetical protein Xbed_02372 [Xenorhabdus beddingii]|uniref:Uncharacterized protein n=1 Tax=Xenorhabdus beddingii TaxID=40578 RepID=A0A1Y2SKZ6_9GAMM|nr:hypothetical protein [Xenorhabdus beddingii]OTA19515.1 hypothetical protein Xbed_02372 [Xenorhabdus beddingii]